MKLSTFGYLQRHALNSLPDGADYNDLFTMLANECAVAKSSIEEYRLNKIRKNIINDSKLRKHHDLATTIEMGLDQAIETFYLLAATDEDRTVIRDTYLQRRRGKTVTDTPLTRLLGKITNTEKILTHFREKTPLLIRRKYYFENGWLYLGAGKAVKILPGTFMEALLLLLFTDPFKRWRNEDLTLEIAGNMQMPLYTSEEIELDSTLKSACLSINRKVSKEIGYEVKLVVHTARVTELDVNLFHHMERINK